MTRFVFSKPAAGTQRSNQVASETEAERHPFAGERIQLTGSVADEGNIPAMNQPGELQQRNADD